MDWRVGGMEEEGRDGGRDWRVGGRGRRVLCVR